MTRDHAWLVPVGCDSKIPTQKIAITFWPKTLESWVPRAFRRKNLIPPVLPACSHVPNILVEESITLEGLDDGAVIMKKDTTSRYPEVELSVQGGTGPWYWFENARLQTTGASYLFKPEHPGSYQLLVIDQSGAVDQIKVDVY